MTKVSILQQPSLDWSTRNKLVGFDFVHEFECSDSWRDLTNKGKLVIPKNLYFRDANNKLQPLHGSNVNVGGFGSQVPLLLRGDRVSIEAGYKYFNASKREITDTAVMFTGFISKVHSKIPMEMEIEDNMWLLKQTPMDKITFKTTDTLEHVLQVLISKVNAVWKTSFTVNITSSTNVGKLLMMGNESACQFLQKLQKLYGFESYFRGDELRSGVLIYLPADNINPDGTPKKPNIFAFQNNIIEDELEYVRKDDIKLSAVAHNTITEETGATCKDGTKKTKHKRLEVLVAIKTNATPGDLPYTINVISPTNPISENTDGERRTFHFPGAKSIAELADQAYQKLKVYYYSGLRGKFTTFGIPFTRQGDNIKIQDAILPERNGLYKVKQVEYTGGVGGLRQHIHLDFMINT